MEDQQTRTMTWMAGILLALVAVVVLIKPGEEEDDGDKTTLATTDPFPDLKAEAITSLLRTEVEAHPRPGPRHPPQPAGRRRLEPHRAPQRPRR